MSKSDTIMDSKLIVVFKGNLIDSEIVKDILNDNEVIASIKNQLMGTIAPWYVSPGGLDPVEIEILQKDEEKALGLIAEFHKSK